MNRRDLFWLAIIIALIAGAIWIITNPQYPARPGLDLQGGLQVLLAADVPESRDLDAGEMDTARPGEVDSWPVRLDRDGVCP